MRKRTKFRIGLLIFEVLGIVVAGIIFSATKSVRISGVMLMIYSGNIVSFYLQSCLIIDERKQEKKYEAQLGSQRFELWESPFIYLLGAGFSSVMAMAFRMGVIMSYTENYTWPIVLLYGLGIHVLTYLFDVVCLFLIVIGYNVRWIVGENAMLYCAFGGKVIVHSFEQLRLFVDQGGVLSFVFEDYTINFGSYRFPARKRYPKVDELSKYMKERIEER